MTDVAADAEVNDIIAELVAAGLVTVGTDIDWARDVDLTTIGAQVATQVAMSGDGSAGLLDVLLGPED